MGQQIVEFGMEGRVFFRRLVMALQIEDQRHQRFGDEAAAENAEMPALVRAGAEGIGIFQFQYRLAPRSGPCFKSFVASDLSGNRFALSGPML